MTLCDSCLNALIAITPTRVSGGKRVDGGFMFTKCLKLDQYMQFDVVKCNHYFKRLHCLLKTAEKTPS